MDTNKTIDSILICAATFVVLYVFLGDGLIHPDKYVFTFGGDGLIIYYNMIWHAMYGSGLELTNMNHPVGESLLMTDAQASLAWLFSLFDGVPLLAKNYIGTIHLLHYIFLALASVYLYLVLRMQNVARLIAIPFALIIVFLSPQMMRMTCGHFGLAYPVVFTASVYYLLNYLRDEHWKYGLGLFAVILLFGLNNIYLLILSSGLISLTVITYALLRKSPSSLWALVYTALPVIIAFALIKSTSPQAERIIIQWGYIANKTDFIGLVIPETGLLGHWFDMQSRNFEGKVNLGLINLIVVVGTLISLLFAKGRRFIRRFFSDHLEITSLLIASIPMLIYALGAFELLTELLPAATMFKASGRFAWPFYYALSIASVCLVQYIYSAVAKAGKARTAVAGVAVLMAFGVWEASLYLPNHVRFTLHGNPVSYEELNRLRDEYTAVGIDKETYQAFYIVPVLADWNDKYQMRYNFAGEYHTIRASLATGIPMISGKYSRMGLVDMNRIVQFGSHPYIPREYLDSLDSRPVLIAEAVEANLTRGEQFLVDHSELIIGNDEIAFHHLDVQDIRNYSPSVRCDSLDAKPHFYEGFEDRESDLTFFGRGSLTFDENVQLLEIPEEHITPGWNELSYYAYITHERAGVPFVRLHLYDGSNKIREEVYDTGRSKDVVGYWRRGNHEFTVEPNITRIEVELFNVNQPFTIDELLLREVNDTVCIHSPYEDTMFMYNNFRLPRGALEE